MMLSPCLDPVASQSIKSGTDDFFPRDGSWDLYNKRLVEPTKIEGWFVVNFSVLCNSRDIVTDLIRVGRTKGVKIDPPMEFIEEKPQFKRDPPVVRVEKMFEEIKSKLHDRPKFIMCLLPERKYCDIYACKFLDKEWDPKFVFIVAQKNHHTRFFQKRFPDNIPPGTIIDNEVCHPRNCDFYLCAHSAKIGTTRPTHYHVLHDEIGISPDDLQELVHNLSYVYQRSTSATSIVSPLRYAHLAAAYMAQWLKSEEAPETSSGRLQLPRLHRRVSSSMFFC